MVARHPELARDLLVAQIAVVAERQRDPVPLGQALERDAYPLPAFVGQRRREGRRPGLAPDRRGRRSPPAPAANSRDSRRRRRSTSRQWWLVTLRSQRSNGSAGSYRSIARGRRRKTSLRASSAASGEPQEVAAEAEHAPAVFLVELGEARPAPHAGHARRPPPPRSRSWPSDRSTSGWPRELHPPRPARSPGRPWPPPSGRKGAGAHPYWLYERSNPERRSAARTPQAAADGPRRRRSCRSNAS